MLAPATAEAAREAGFGDIREGQGTAKALAGAVIKQLASGGGAEPAQESRRLVYLAGTPRTTIIEDAFSGAGHPLVVPDCYEMRKISYSTDFLNGAILSPSPDAVLLYSANAARRAAKLFGPQTQTAQRIECSFLGLSNEIAAVLPAPWRDRAIVAATPDEASLLASLAALR